MSKVQKNISKSKKGLGIFIIIVLLILCGIFWFYKQYKIININVKGYDYYTKDEIIQKVIKDPFDKNTIFLSFRYKYFEQPIIPFVDKLDVDVVDNHTVNIVVYEKVLSGCIEYMGEYLYFDKDGVIVESSKDKLDKVLFIEGLKYEQIVLHQKLEVQNDEMFKEIMDLTQLINKYDINIDRLIFNRDEEVTLVAGGIRFLLGKQEAYDERIARVSDLLPKAESFKNGYFDLRTFTGNEDKIIFHKE